MQLDYTQLFIKFALGILTLIIQINVFGKSNLAPTTALDQLQNYVLGGIIGGLNDTHLSVAKKIGIRPLASRSEAEGLGGKLVQIKPCERYAMDSLTHSIPFLIPQASALLDTIGANFLDSLSCKGLNPNQIIVTSVLRTADDVKRLRRRNGNASANSAHAFGTTFDVSYRRFCKVEDPDGRPMQDVSPDTLKLVLAEVLRDLRKSDKCYIKYELKQGCFHITAR